MKTAIGLALAVLLLGILATTRIGVFIVFDVLGDIVDQSDDLVLSAAAGPLQVTESRKAIDVLDLPPDLQQPSGIHISDSAVYLLTDQAELYSLSHQGQTEFQVDLLGGPLLLKQGSLESVVVWGREVLVVGELGHVSTWSLDDGAIVKKEPRQLLPPYDSLEYTGLMMFGGSLVAVDDDSTAIHDLTHGKSFELDFTAVVKPDMNPSDLLFSGIAADSSRIYIVTENFTSILVVSPNGWKVERVIDIDDVEASDIAVYQGHVFVTVDHNYFDEPSPVLVYDGIAATLY